MLIVVPLAYVLGGIPFGLLVGRWAARIDVREFGSGNIGATNVTRVLGRRWGVLVFLLDGLKGFAVVWFARAVGEPWTVALAALAVVLGHCYSVFLNFRGGKGVATLVGVLFGLDPLVGSAAVVVWVSAYLLFRISAVGGLSAAIAAPIIFFISQPRSPFPIVTAVLAVVIVIRHRENIRGLLRS